MNKPANHRQNPTQHFRERIESVKIRLKGTDWKSRFLLRNPNWNNLTDLTFLNNVYLGRATDVFVTQELEAIAEATNPKPVTLVPVC